MKTIRHIGTVAVLTLGMAALAAGGASAQSSTDQYGRSTYGSSYGERYGQQRWGDDNQRYGQQRWGDDRSAGSGYGQRYQPSYGGSRGGWRD
jgi:hypothetical protein